MRTVDELLKSFVLYMKQEKESYLYLEIRYKNGKFVLHVDKPLVIECKDGLGNTFHKALNNLCNNYGI